MRSAFERGIKLLSEPEPDSVQRQRTSAGEESFTLPAPEQIEGAVKVPKNVTQLRSLINNLGRKVIVIAS
jgi:hypothetical protein